MKIKLWKKRLARHALALGIPEKDILLVDTKSTPEDIQTALRSLNPNPSARVYPWTSRWHFLLQYIKCPEFLEPTEQYEFHYLEQTCFQIQVADGFDPARVREDLIRQAGGYFTHVIVVTDTGTEVRKRTGPPEEFPPQFEVSTTPDEPMVTKGEQPTPNDPAPKIPKGGIAIDGRFLARLGPEAVSELEHVAETEDISLNEALDLVLRRHRYYPRDWREIHEQVQYNILQLELVEELMEASQRHEEMLLRLLEGGTVDSLIQEFRMLEREGKLPKLKPDPSTPSQEEEIPHGQAQ